MEMLLALLLFVVFFAAMALGVILRGKPLQGSCGGAATLMGEKTCGACGRDPHTCERRGAQRMAQVVLTDRPPR